MAIYFRSAKVYWNYLLTKKVASFISLLLHNISFQKLEQNSFWFNGLVWVSSNFDELLTACFTKKKFQMRKLFDEKIQVKKSDLHWLVICQNLCEIQNWFWEHSHDVRVFGRSIWIWFYQIGLCSKVSD